MEKQDYSKEKQLTSEKGKIGDRAEFTKAKFQQGDKVYHRSSGAPMVVVAVDGENIKTRWIDNGLNPQLYNFFDFELELELYTEDLSTFKQIQKLNNDAQLLQTKIALKNLRAQSNGIAPAQLNNRFPKTRH